MNARDPILHRHKDGSLAIAESPELFICSRESLEMLVDDHNQAIASRNDARTLAGELIAAIRVNTLRGTFAAATPKQVDDWLQPFIQRINTQQP